MKKFLSFFAAMLVAVAVNASTDFAAPGYYCAADDAVITGDAPSNKVYLDESADPHHIAWSDVSKTYTAVIKWTVAATRACYISVSLDLGPTISSNKHIFEVKVLNANGDEVGALEEGPAYTGDGFTDANTVKALTGKIMIPAPGDYTVELRNNRDFCKGSIKNVILTYAGAAPITDFATPGYSCAADDATLSGTVSSSFGLNTDGDDHYVFWSDRALSSPAAASWSLIATRACYITASLDLGPVISSNKHIFEIKVLDAQGEEVGTAAEPGESTEANQVKALTQQILIPEAGSYTIELRNNRDWGKGAVKNVILTYAADAPAEEESQELYLKISSDWSYPAKYAIYYFNDGANGWSDFMTLVEGEDDTYVGSIPADFADDNIIFVRLNGEATTPNWNDKWSQTVNLTIPEGKDFFTVVSGGTGDQCNGTWSKYGEVVPEPKFRIAGSMSEEWAPSIESFEDSYTLHLAAGTHRLKVVTLENAWKGYTDLTEANRAAEIFPDQSGNICFVLAAEGDVVVTYTNELYKVEGAFIPAPVQLIGIGGWDAETYAIALTPAEDHLTASVTLNLDEWYYEFKMIVAGAWLGKENAEGLYNLHREWTSVDGLTYEGGNIKLTMDAQDIVPGDYIFTWEYATGKLTVTFPTPAPTGITWELNGGAVLPKGCDTNEELWEAFKPDYNAFYSAARADQPIDKVSTFVQDNPGSKSMMMSETSGWKWLGDYLIASCADQGDESWDLSAGTDQQWRMTLHSFFNKEDKTGWPMGSSHALFSEAGKEEHWLAAYAEMVLPESVSAEYTLPAAYKEGVEFGGWFDNAEFNGEALTVIPANYAGTLYAKWVSPSTNIENTAAAVKAIKIIENGKLIIIRNGVRYNAQGQME